MERRIFVSLAVWQEEGALEIKKGAEQMAELSYTVRYAHGSFSFEQERTKNHHAVPSVMRRILIEYKHDERFRVDGRIKR